MLVNLADWLRVAAILIKPFLPRTAETFYRAFNFEETKAWDQVGYADARPPLAAGPHSVTAPMTRRQAGAAVSQDRIALADPPRGNP